tara:strand:- start:599 stop:1108 length:510 start_codon:yes stop_codon:yes gene_type:complete
LKQFKKTWPVRVEKEIKANSDEIWKIISKEGNLNLVHPFCKNNYAISWGSENSVDVLEYLNGLIFIREFQTWNPGKGYSLLIGTKNGKKSYVEWKIRSKNKKQYLSITVYPHYMIKYPKFISFFPYEFMVKPNLKKYLESVIGGINYYLTKNKTVPKNNFGEHNWFSKK